MTQLDVSKQLRLVADRIALGGPVKSWDPTAIQAGMDHSNPNPRLRMLRGEWTGGCGFQPNAYAVIDANFLCGPGLAQFYPEYSATIIENVNYWLGVLRYDRTERHEVVFGRQVPAIYGVTQNVIAYGKQICPPPPLGETGVFVAADMPDHTRTLGPTGSRAAVFLALQAGLQRNRGQVELLHRQLLDWWEKGKHIGFYDPGVNPANRRGGFDGGILAMYLLMVRALRLNSPIEGEVERQLWSLQDPKLGNGLAGQYNLDGSLAPNRTTGYENTGFTLLAYDPRLTTEWWPA